MEPICSLYQCTLAPFRKGKRAPLAIELSEVGEVDSNGGTDCCLPETRHTTHTFLIGVDVSDKLLVASALVGYAT